MARLAHCVPRSPRQRPEGRILARRPLLVEYPSSRQAPPPPVHGTRRRRLRTTTGTAPPGTLAVRRLPPGPGWRATRARWTRSARCCQRPCRSGRRACSVRPGSEGLRLAARRQFERILHAAQANADAAGDIEWVVPVDSSIVRAHQHAAGAQKRGLHSPAPGRPSGWLTSKIHLACAGSGRPLAFALSGDDTNDCTRCTTVMEAIRLPSIGLGRPRTRPDHVIGDKGWDRGAGPDDGGLCLRPQRARHGTVALIPSRGRFVSVLWHP
ncbi:hypothetical protein M2167_001019 [Streptomyces sp. SPB4]|nr:hypothetical protein [Streptomyces sp. SPB4]